MTRPAAGLVSAFRSMAEDSIPDGVQVAIDARVVSYDRTTQTASVQPVVRAVYQIGDREVAVELPELKGVPVQWPATSGAALHLPLAAGDRVLLIIRDRSHDEIDQNGIPSSGTVEPDSARRFSLSDAVAVPAREEGGLPSEATNASDPVLYMTAGGTLRIGDGAATQALALAQETAAKIRRIESYLNQSTFSVVPTGGGPAIGVTTAPTPSPFAGATGSLFALASAVAAPEAATLTANVASTRVSTDG